MAWSVQPVLTEMALVPDSLVGQLENTYLVEPDGTKHKLPKRN